MAELPDDGGEFLNNIEFIETTEQEVHDLLNTSKATGPDCISPKLLHEADAAIVPFRFYHPQEGFEYHYFFFLNSFLNH